MNGTKIFGHEPALVVGAINALIMVGATLGFTFLTGDQAPLWVAIVNGGSAVILALTIRPLSVPVFSQFFGALVALVAGYGINLSPDFVFAINAALMPILMVLSRGQVSPIASAVTAPSNDPTPEAAAFEANKAQG